MPASAPDYTKMSTEKMSGYMARLWDRTGGKAWEPPNTKHEIIEWGVANGYLRRVDGRCMFERFKDSHVTWTEAAKVAFGAADHFRASPAPTGRS